MENIYYISQGKTPEEHVFQIEKVCRAGCKLVQLRMKDISENIYIHTAQKALTICKSLGARLIINDSLPVVKAVNADGIHLGKEDMNPQEARKQLGSDKLIGVTANTLEDCLQWSNKELDYIGLGPYRFTKTKQNLSPILGLSGYERIIKSLKDKKNIPPIYAVGGILEDDFEKLFAIGINGVALSGLFTHASEEEIRLIIKK